jgi:hypothetical protein
MNRTQRHIVYVLGWLLLVTSGYSVSQAQSVSTFTPTFVPPTVTVKPEVATPTPPPVKIGKENPQNNRF